MRGVRSRRNTTASDRPRRPHETHPDGGRRRRAGPRRRPDRAGASDTLAGGTTTLKLDAAVAKALSGAGVSVTPIGRARADGSGVALPDHRRLDRLPRPQPGRSGTAAGCASAVDGKFHHAQGLQRSGRQAGSASRRASATPRDGPRPDRRAEGDAGRASTPTSPACARGSPTAAAKALNATFGVHAFRKGIKLGTVRVTLADRRTELLAGGAPDRGSRSIPGRSQALTSLGIAPGVIAPATLTAATAANSRSRAAGRADLSSGHDQPLRRDLADQGRDRRDAGRRSTSGSGRRPQLFAAINGGAQKAAILDLDLTGVHPGGRRVATVTLGRCDGEADAGRGRRAQRARSPRPRSAPGSCSGSATVVAEGA